MIRCGGPCDKPVAHEGAGLPAGWRFVMSRDPNAPRLDLIVHGPSGLVARPAGGPSVAMCPACADITECADLN